MDFKTGRETVLYCVTLMLENITPLILTCDESVNISRCLEKLRWAKRIVMVDSFSHDDTCSISEKFGNVDFFQRRFDSFAAQANWGIGKATTEWVLSLDADYVLTDDLIVEISQLNLSQAVDGYFVSFKYCMAGRPLRSTLLPPREVLFRKDKAYYVQDGHAHKLKNAGVSAILENYIYHDDRKAFMRWWQAQLKYSKQEAEKLTSFLFGDLNPQDKLRKMIFFAPVVVLFYCLFWKGLIWDGWNGVIYSFQRMLAELLLSFNLIRKLLKL